MGFLVTKSDQDLDFILHPKGTSTEPYSPMLEQWFNADPGEESILQGVDFLTVGHSSTMLA